MRNSELENRVLHIYLKSAAIDAHLTERLILQDVEVGKIQAKKCKKTRKIDNR